MSERFYLESPPQDGIALLSASEAHHLAHVMRAKAGDEVLLFDGSGVEYAGRVEHVGRSEIRLTIVSQCVVDRELAADLHLGVALPKGERQRWLVEKVVELGVRRLTPLVTERGVAQPTGSAIARLHRAVIEASKQCGRNRLMEIAEPAPLATFLCNETSDRVKLLAHPQGVPLRSVLAASDLHAPAHGAQLAIGPEGGFSDDEIATAREHGWQIVSLGSRTLRVETAAVALVAAFLD